MNHLRHPAEAPRFVPLINDKVFKLVFSEPANKDILIALLNILIPGKNIQDLTYLDKEIHGFVFQDKSTIFDVYCETDSHEQFVVEMQARGQEHFADRMLVYSTYPVREQIVRKFGSGLRGLMRRLRGKRKIDYTLLPIYMVSLTNFGMPHGSEAVLEDGLVSRYSIRDDHAGELMTDALHFVFFEIGRLPYKVGEESRCTSRLQKIACAIRYMAEYREVPAALRDEILVERMFEASTIANMTVKQRKYYDKSIMETWIDRQAQMDFAVNKAMKQGLEQGIAKGIEQGAARRNIEIARAMLKDHVDIKTVAKYSGISEKELQTLSSQEFLNK